MALRQGNAAAAVAAFGQAARAEPAHAESHLNLGVALAMSGRQKEAREVLERASKLAPGNPDIHYNLGLVLLALNRHRDAAERFEKALKKKPKESAIHLNLALALRSSDDREKAERHMRRAAQLDPKNAMMQVNLGNLYLEIEDSSRARHCFEKALSLQPNNVRALVGLGLVGTMEAEEADNLEKMRRLLDNAIASSRAALDAAPGDVGAMNALGVALEKDARWDEADQALRAAFEHTVDRRPGGPLIKEAIYNRARFLLNSGRADEAAEVCRKGLERTGYDERLVADLSTILVDLGRFDEAAAVCATHEHQGFSKVDALNMLNVEASRPLSGADLSALEQCLKREEGSPSLLSATAMTLFRYHDRENDPDRAFPYLEQSKTWAASQEVPYDREAMDQVAKAIRDTFSSGIPANLADGGSNSDQPVFIVGMPRSGTTLVEQILSSHPEVLGAGELTLIPAAAQLFQGTERSDNPYSVRFIEANQRDLADLADWYLARLRRCGGEKARITDKLPGNFMYLGLISLLFPRAHIIHCVRDPMATCFSILSQNFPRGHPYANDQSNLAHQYRFQDDLMSFWKAVLPARIHTVAYEDLIDRQEASTRDLIDFCGLPWDDGCLRFFESDRAVKTSSKWQVRQPVYRTSLEKWRIYETYLAPLKEGLETGGVLSGGQES
ncbi:sulfotransferase [Magnetospira sp. QH-2]|uniref:sulfotransferase n=1 Tax=Magnetospira sp. (strain QH-2) TaxID=1288970 RepID=UPI0003E80FCC|nr:sulfotransferase [Magnetospira sp. QH-2]CCQ73695.1 Conserved exported protein of unknown function, containing protein-tyrosine sulfotransferase domain [Magnetospira sp. QH-2]